MGQFQCSVVILLDAFGQILALLCTSVEHLSRVCVVPGGLSALTREINYKKLSLSLLYYILLIKCSQLLGQKSALKAVSPGSAVNWSR